MFECGFQLLFYKLLFYYFKKNWDQTLFLLFYASKVPFAKFIKFYWKTLFYFENTVATILKGYFKNSIKPLHLVGDHLILKYKIYEEIKKTEKKREKKK
jgi:hypothetical protein